MKSCPYCAEEIQDAAKVCKHCGRDLATGTVAAGAPAKKTTSAGVGCLAIIMAFGLMGWCMSLVTPDTSTSTTATPERQRHSDVAAFVMCQRFVRDALKSPSTASFPSGSTGHTEDRSDGLYRITAWVDSQNAFGATVRNDFTCDIQWVEDDRWRLVDLQFQSR